MRCDVNELKVHSSSCGGTVVEEEAVVTLSTWVFDAEGQLIGGSYEDEGTCASWGAPCDSVGAGEPLCGSELGCIEHDSCGRWGANFGCPPSVDDVGALCSLGLVDSKRYASDCDGTVVELGNGIQSVAYSFDADGKLIGVSAAGDAGDCDRWGTHCAPVGEAEDVCEGAGGTGGAEN
jgi:hypothetical protein